MVFDTLRRVTMMFGGNYFNQDDDVSYDLSDTWEYDGESWTFRAVPEWPAPRDGHAMAYDSWRAVTVLFGGAVEGGSNTDETWEWDGQNWTLVDVVDKGDAGSSAGKMAFDSVCGVTVRAGGFGKGADSVWEWDGETWSEIVPTDHPPRRINHALAYDSARDAIVMFGGRSELFGGDPLGDTWEYVCPPPCPPDLDGDGELTLFDFLTFTNLFNAADPKADCDQSQVLDLFDFLCFTNAFNAGC